MASILTKNRSKNRSKNEQFHFRQQKTKDKHNKQPSVQTTIDHWIIITITYHFQLQRFVNQQAVLKKHQKHVTIPQVIKNLH